MLVLDCDGVLTDGGVYYLEEGGEAKRFNIQDGLGIKAAQRIGLEIAVISGLDSPPVRRRVTELGITEYFGGHHRKVPILEDICARNELTMAELAFLGDDWVDAAPLKVVGLPMAVANAQPEIVPLALYRTTAAGGQGAVREAIRFILEAQGSLDSAFAQWLE